MRPARRPWPARPAPKRLGYPTPREDTRILAVVRPAKGEEGMVDPWSAVWMDRTDPAKPGTGQVAGSTFTASGTRCAFFEPTPFTHTNGERSYYGRALSDRQRRLRVAWAKVPPRVRRAVLQAIREWNASAEYVPVGGAVKRGLSGKTDLEADANATGHSLPTEDPAAPGDL